MAILQFDSDPEAPLPVPQFAHLHCQGWEEMTLDLAAFWEQLALGLESADPSAPSWP